MTTRFWIGETVRARFVFTDPDTGGTVTPSGVVVRARKPNGMIVSYAASVSGNTAIADIPTDVAGDWWVRATATSPSPAAEEVMFTVVQTNII